MLSETLRDLRKAKHVSQMTMSEDLGVSQATVACWESNRRRPDIDMLPILADYFGVSLDTLMERSTDQETEDVWALREEVRRDPERRALFSLARSASIHDVRQALAVLDALKKTGGGEDD